MRTLLPVLCCTVSALAQGTFPGLYRVDEHVYRGKQPAKGDITVLAKMGIKTVLDLRGGVYKRWERQAVETAGMRYVRIGLSGLFAPTDRQMQQILTLLEDPANGPVFVHCRRGADRTGLVIACYRIDHDHWSNAQAMDEARHQGFSGLEVLMQRYVKNYRPKVSADGR